MRSRILAAGAGASIATALVLRSAVRIPMTATIRPPSLIATLPSPWWWILAAVAGCTLGGALAGWFSDPRRQRALWPLWIPGLAAAAYVPGALALFPALSAFSGALLDLVLAGSVAVALGRGLASRTTAIPLRAGSVALVTFVLLWGVGEHLQRKVGLSGDEPHYLLITYSLLKDHDLQVADNYAARDYLRFYPGKIGPHLAHGTTISVHGVGLPLLLLPGFALAGLSGVLLTEVFLGALLATEIFRLATRYGMDRAAAGLAVVGCIATAPGLFLSVSAYPELPVALVVAATFRKAASRALPARAAAMAWGLGFGLLPFFHIKYIPLALVLTCGAAACWRARRWWLAAGAAAGMMVLLLYFWALLGSPNPLASYGTQRLFIERIPLGLAGLLFDQEFGLLAHAPVYCVALAGVGTLLAKRPGATLWMLAVTASVALPGAAHPLWSGGTSPPARFLFPALPLLAVAAAALWRCPSPRGIGSCYPTLLTASLCLAAFMALGPGQPLYLNGRDGTGRLWEALGGSWDLTHYLPSLILADRRSLVLAGAAALVLTAALVAEWKWRTRLPGPLGIALGAMFVIDAVSPAVAPEASHRRWMQRALEEVAQHPAARWLRLPSARPISRTELLREVSLPLRSEELSSISSAKTTLRLPAGEYEIRWTSSTRSTGAYRLCNGEGCFADAVGAQRFSTRLCLARFHVRGEPAGRELALVPRRVGPLSPLALRTLGFAGGLRIHGLDDGAFLDPKGYWVRGGARARFAVECEEASSCIVAVVNGPRENWIQMELQGSRQRFRLAPNELRKIRLPVEQGLCLLSVMSRSGFRPAELDPRQRDRRLLGVFLTTGRHRPRPALAFDGPRNVPE